MDEAKSFMCGLALWVFIAVGYSGGQLAIRAVRFIAGLLFSY